MPWRRSARSAVAHGRTRWWVCCAAGNATSAALVAREGGGRSYACRSGRDSTGAAASAFRLRASRGTCVTSSAACSPTPGRVRAGRVRCPGRARAPPSSSRGEVQAKRQRRIDLYTARHRSWPFRTAGTPRRTGALAEAEIAHAAAAARSSTCPRPSTRWSMRGTPGSRSTPAHRSLLPPIVVKPAGARRCVRSWRVGDRAARLNKAAARARTSRESATAGDLPRTRSSRASRTAGWRSSPRFWRHRATERWSCAMVLAVVAPARAGRPPRASPGSRPVDGIGRLRVRARVIAV